MIGKNNNNRLVRKALAFLVAFFILVTSPGVCLATPQEDLDKGKVSMTSNSSVILRTGETYYIALKGGKGRSGDGVYKDYYDGTTGYEYGSSGSDGAISYYKIENVVGNTTIQLYLNGTSSFGGKGNSGTAGGPWSADGGGGGDASVATLNGTGNRLTASGGSGGSGARYTFQKEDGKWYYYTSDVRGDGGSGGHVASVINDTTKVTITQLSSSEGAAYVTATSVAGMAIKKKRSDTFTSVKVSDLTVGDKIILSNSTTGTSTIFEKTSVPYEFRYFSGIGTGYWYDFPKYVVSGSSGGSSMLIKTKQDLTFVGGDASGIFPYYPEPAGSTETSGSSNGGSAEDNAEYMENLQNSIISVAQQLENQLNYEKEKEEEKNEIYTPFSISLKSTNGASATTGSAINLILNISGKKIDEVMYKVSVNGSISDTWLTVPSTNLITVDGLSDGYNTVIVTVKDSGGNSQSDVFNIWKL